MEYEAWKNPDINVVMHFVEAFDVNYHKGEMELEKVFNSKSSEIVIKERVKLLDSYYRTGIKRNLTSEMFDKMMRNLMDLSLNDNLEERIASGDPKAVKDIAIPDKGINCFVFATKYCSFLNEKKYPIYDSQVNKALTWFKKNGDRGFYSKSYLCFEKKRQGCDYKGFRGVIEEYKKCYELDEVSYKELDKFLWIVGKNM